MIPLATQITPEPVVDTFPEGLEDDNKQSGESDDNLTEQEQTESED